MKNKGKKPLVIISFIVLIMIIGISITLYTRVEMKKETNSGNKIIPEVADNESSKDEEVIKEETDSLEEESTAENIKEEETKTNVENNTQNNSTNISKNNKNNSTSNNSSTKSNNTGSNSNSSVNTNTPSTNSTNSNSNQSSNTSSETNDEVKNDNNTASNNNTSINNSTNNNTTSNSKDPDPNDFYYQEHKGVTNTKTKSACKQASEEIAFLDTVDINYCTCYAVPAKDGTILGYFVNVFCNSGNCNRYKSQIDWTKYD